MISIEMEFTIKNHPSLTMENKNENKKRFGWQRLGKRRTKQSEKHVTVYPLETDSKWPWTVEHSKREKGATVSQRREHSIMGERRKKQKMS